MRGLWQIVLVFLAVLMLNGCVNTELNEPANRSYTVESPQKRADQLRGIVAWRNSGAFSVKMNNKLNAANFIWEQSSRYRYRIRVESALNIKSFTMIGNYRSVTLWTTETKEFHARTPEQVMQKELGWSLPVSNMYYWVRNLPAPGRVQQQQYDQYGHLHYLVQNGWQIRYTGFVTKDGIDYPRLIELYRSGIYIRMVVKHWIPYTQPMYGNTINEQEKSL